MCPARSVKDVPVRSPDGKHFLFHKRQSAICRYVRRTSGWLEACSRPELRSRPRLHAPRARSNRLSAFLQKRPDSPRAFRPGQSPRVWKRHPRRERSGRLCCLLRTQICSSHTSKSGSISSRTLSYTHNANVCVAPLRRPICQTKIEQLCAPCRSIGCWPVSTLYG